MFTFPRVGAEALTNLEGDYYIHYTNMFREMLILIQDVVFVLISMLRLCFYILRSMTDGYSDINMDGFSGILTEMSPVMLLTLGWYAVLIRLDCILLCLFYFTNCTLT